MITLNGWKMAMAGKSITLSLIIIVILTSIAAGLSNPIASERISRHEARIIEPISNHVSQYEYLPKAAKFADFSDIKISETIGPATFSQKNSSVALLDDGKFVAVWQDNRLGSYKIYAQAFDSTGNKINANVLIIGRNDGYNLIEPKAVSNGTGGFYLAWRDEISGKIMAAAYDISFNELIAPFAINDTQPENYAGPFDIDSYAASRFVVVWEDYGSANNIALRIYSSIGQALTGPIKINSDTLPAAHWVPSISFDHLGAIAAVWEDYRHGNADIFLQLINAEGSLNGSNLGVVEGLHDDSAQYLPQIAYSQRDGYAISWLDGRNGTQKVYLQRYELGGGFSGGNVEIPGDDSSAVDWDIAMDVNSTNDLNMTWASIGATANIMLQRFGVSFVLEDLAIVVNNSVMGARWESDICFGISDKIICTWTDFRFGHGDIFMQYLSSEGISLLSGDSKINDDSEGAGSTEPDIAFVGADRNIIVFSDSRNDAGDIFGQLISNDGSLLGSNIRLNTDATGFLQSEPSVAVSDTAALTVWIDTRSVSGLIGPRIFGRYLDLDGQALGEDFAISDSANIAVKNGPAVAVTPDNRALIAWIDLTGGTAQIMGRFLNDDATYSGPVFTISTFVDDIGNEDVDVAVDGSGIFTVGWLAGGAPAGPLAIFVRYNGDGSLLNRFSFTSPINGVDIKDIAVEVDNSGRIYLFWEGSNNALYFSRFESNGIIDIASSEIASGSGIPYNPHIAIDNDGNVILTRIENDNGIRRAFYQLLNSSLLTFRQGFVSTADVEFMADPVSTAANQMITFAWSDPRDGGENIYGTRISFSSTDILDDKPIVIPAQFALKQNYPNPFNPSTSIAFSLPVKSDVKITIYNILGERVLTLAGNIFDAGQHTIEWDGKDASGNNVASGMYLYKMRAGEFRSTRKMFLIK